MQRRWFNEVPICYADPRELVSTIYRLLNIGSNYIASPSFTKSIISICIDYHSSFKFEYNVTVGTSEFDFFCE